MSLIFMKCTWGLSFWLVSIGKVLLFSFGMSFHSDFSRFQSSFTDSFLSNLLVMTCGCWAWLTGPSLGHWRLIPEHSREKSASPELPMGCSSKFGVPLGLPLTCCFHLFLIVYSELCLPAYSVWRWVVLVIVNRLGTLGVCQSVNKELPTSLFQLGQVKNAYCWAGPYTY